MESHLSTKTDATINDSLLKLDLSSSDNLLLNFLADLDDGLFIIDDQFRLVYFNKNASNFLKHAYSSFNCELGDSVINALPEHRRKPIERYFKTVLEGEKITYQIEIPVITRDSFWLECKYFPIRNNKGDVVAIGGTIADRTYREAYKRQLMQRTGELTSILDSITDGFYTLDRQWIIRYANSQAGRMVGLDSEKAVGKCIWDLFPEAKDMAFYTAYKQAFDTGEQVHLEIFYPPLNIWLDLSIYPSRDLLSIYLKDITEKKQKDQLLQEINQRYEWVSKATSQAIWQWDIGSDMCFWYGENYQKLFGYGVVNEYEPCKQWRENLLPVDADRIINTHLEAVHNNKEYWSDTYWFRKANGEYAFVQDRAFIVRDANGKALRMIGAMDDITARKKAEEALALSENWYRLLFNQGPIPQIIFETGTLQIKQVNEAALLLYGYSIDEFLDMTLLDIKPIKDHEPSRNNVDLASKSGRTYKGTWIHLNKKGEEMIVDVVSTGIIYEGREALLATMIDITEKVRLEEKILNLKLEEQKKISKATIQGQEKERELIGAELHDNINQVLTTTKLYLEIAYEKEEYRMDLIQKSKQNIINTINEIRFLCKMLIPSAIKDVGLSDSIQDLIESYKLTQKFKIHFTHKGCFNELPRDFKVNLFRIIQEQLNNIAKYSEASNVWMELSIDKTVSLIIRDDGKGFDPATKSNGVGLLNIKYRTELYDGTVRIISAEGQGCTLGLEFPMVGTKA
jgi:PAS domain S-box-containing protein